MKFLYVLLALPLLAVASPAPVPSSYGGYGYVKRYTNPVLAKRQATVADLKRRAYYNGDDGEDGHHDGEGDDGEGDDGDDEHHHKKYPKPSYYPRARATGAA